ncbi:MAG: dihydrodipicolinate reductase [Candidatus Latescibacteria bacterium]|nr:dihydrodipicolinate reductase [Candidatus Latescibacterota bacterium]
MRKIRVIHYGVGWIGTEAARLVLRKNGMQIVGALDLDEEKVGSDLGEVINIPERLGVIVSNDAPALFNETEADIVVHTTSSRFEDVYPQIEEIVSAGINVVSSAEEMLVPVFRHPDLAGKLDRLAKAKGVTALGTGVNPGFVMDTLPLFLTSVCHQIRRLKVKRVVDASTRRAPLQRKIGAGLTPKRFREGVSQGELGHVGLVESLLFIACGLGWKLSQIKESVDPVIAETELETEYVRVNRGHVSGINQIARGYKDGQEVIRLELQMYVGADVPHDSIQIEGEPNLDLRINGGTAGDIATAAMLVNCIPRVVESSPGLLTMKDLSLPYAVSNHVSVPSTGVEGPAKN